jgi:undecaprenyl-diphosphatase
MTVTGRVGPHGAGVESLLSRFTGNLTGWIAALAARPCVSLAIRPYRLAVGAALALAAVALAMWLLDSWTIGHYRGVPRGLVIASGEITQFGKSDWFLLPSAVLLAAIAATASPALGRMSYGVLLSLAARFGFVFLAVGVPSLFVTIAKRMIGRARPLRIADSDVYFAPFAWRVEFASMPSGHSTTAFAAALALGALFPRARVALWIYAALVAASRVILTAHYPSDVIAGAVVGACGALIVRRWFAARRLAFMVRPDGSIAAMPGPSLQRIRRVARRLLGQ